MSLAARYALWYPKRKQLSDVEKEKEKKTEKEIEKERRSYWASTVAAFASMRSANRSST